MSAWIPAGGADASPLAGWTRLELEGRKFLVARGRAAIERWSEPELVFVTSEVRILGSRKEHLAWAEPDPETGGPGRWLEVTPGRRARTHRFDGCRGALVVGFFRARDRNSPGWTFERLDLVETGRAAGDAEDPWSILAHLAPLTEPGRHELTVLTRRGMRRFAVTTSAPHRARWSLGPIDGRGARRRYVLDVVRAEIAPADGGETLLGLSGPTVLTIDRPSGALLAIEGERDGIPGRIRLTLRRWSARARPRETPPWGAFEPPPAGGTPQVDAPPRVP